jgi:hypothetical protein
MPGKKTSVWLGQDEIDGWQELGASLTTIVKRGIAAMREDVSLAAELAALRTELQARPNADRLRSIIRDELEHRRTA